MKNKREETGQDETHGEETGMLADMQKSSPLPAGKETAWEPKVLGVFTTCRLTRHQATVPSVQAANSEEGNAGRGVSVEVSIRFPPAGLETKRRQRLI